MSDKKPTIQADCTPEDPNIDPIYPGMYDDLTSMDVISRYKLLMRATLEEDSIYERSKKTIYEYLKDSSLTETEKAKIVTEQLASMTNSLSNSSMSIAFNWANADAKVGYETALINAQAEQTQQQAKKVAADICLLNAQERNSCASTTATLASSIRDNGRVLEYDPNDPCVPLKLYDEGVKYVQMDNYEATKYSTLADSFRKSGKVTLAVDSADGTLKGISGDDNGHTNSQTQVALRQVVSFEDSKRNHAVNASSQTIGQMIASEAELDPIIVDNYNRGMEYLLTNSPSLMPGGPSYLTPVEIDFSTTDTDTVNCDGSTPPVCTMTVQKNQDLDGGGDPIRGYITFRADFPSDSNSRVGDKIVATYNSGEFNTFKDITSTDLTNGYVLLILPSVVLDTAGGAIKQYAIDCYVQDYYGNKSHIDEVTVKIQYSNVR